MPERIRTGIIKFDDGKPIKGRVREGYFKFPQGPKKQKGNRYGMKRTSKYRDLT